MSPGRRLLAALGALLGAAAGQALAGASRDDADQFALAILVSAGLGATPLLLLAPGALALGRPSRRHLLEALAATVLLEGVSAGLYAGLGAPEWTAAGNAATRPVLVGFALVVAAPLFEELFFRGLLLGIAPRVTGIVVTSALFTAAHAPTDLVTGLIALLAGLTYGALRVRSGSTWPSVLAHALGGFAVLAQLTTGSGPPG